MFEEFSLQKERRFGSFGQAYDASEWQRNLMARQRGLDEAIVGLNYWTQRLLAAEAAGIADSNVSSAYGTEREICERNIIPSDIIKWQALVAEAQAILASIPPEQLSYVEPNPGYTIKVFTPEYMAPSGSVIVTMPEVQPPLPGGEIVESQGGVFTSPGGSSTDIAEVIPIVQPPEIVLLPEIKQPPIDMLPPAVTPKTIAAGFDLGSNWPILAIVGIGAYFIFSGRKGASQTKRKRR